MIPITCSTLQGVLTLSYLSTTQVYVLINYTAFIESLFVTFSVGALLWLRYKQPNMERPIKVIRSVHYYLEVTKQNMRLMFSVALFGSVWLCGSSHISVSYPTGYSFSAALVFRGLRIPRSASCLRVSLRDWSGRSDHLGRHSCVRRHSDVEE